jgi:arginase
MALIEAGLLTQLKEDLDYDIDYDNTVHYYENEIPAEDPSHRGMLKPRAVSAVTETLSRQTYEHSREGKFTLTLGGDHSIAIGSISGIARATRERLGREIGVIWVDAHADINIPEMSPSGNIHGMPMAFLTGLAKEEKKDIFGWLQENHLVNLRKLVYIGLRDVDRGEKKLLREHGIKAFSMHDVDRYSFPSLISSHLLVAR